MMQSALSSLLQGLLPMLLSKPAKAQCREWQMIPIIKTRMLYLKNKTEKARIKADTVFEKKEKSKNAKSRMQKIKEINTGGYGKWL